MFLPWDAVKIVYMVYNNIEIHKTQYNEISSNGNGPCFLFWSVLFLLVAIFSISGLLFYQRNNGWEIHVNRENIWQLSHKF